MDNAHAARIATPIGIVRITGVGERITSIAIEATSRGPEQDGGTPALRETAAQLRAYFAQRLDRFDLPLAAASTTRGEELRAALVAIPLGETMTYGEVASRYGSSARAIGGVCRTNPFPIVVPCHRVVSSGATEFYSAGAGPETKALLLAHERQWRNP